MTYKEALKEVESKPNSSFIFEDVEYIWMVVPKSPEHLEKYAKDCLTTSEVFFNETSQRYALDEEFIPFAVRRLL
jgi:hypothetical protein